MAELKYLKDRKDEQEAIMNADNPEIEWFKNEKANLEQEKKDLQVQLLQYESQEKSLKEDLIYLEEKTKATKRKNKLLEVALEKNNKQLRDILFSDLHEASIHNDTQSRLMIKADVEGEQ